MDEKIGDSKLIAESEKDEEKKIFSQASCKVIVKLKDTDEPMEYIFERAGISTEDEGGYLVVPNGKSKEELSKWLEYAPSVSPATYDIIAAAETLKVAEIFARESGDYSQIGMNAPWPILLRGIKKELINSATKAVYDKENEMQIICEFEGEEPFKYNYDVMSENIIDEITNCSINTEETIVTDEEQLRIEAARQAAEETNNARTGFVYGLRYNGGKQAKNRHLSNNSTRKPSTESKYHNNGR